MNAKTKSIINMIVAALGVIAAIIFIIAIVKTLGFLQSNAFELQTKDGKIDKVNPGAWKLIHDGGVIKGTDLKWGGKKDGTAMQQVAAFRKFVFDNVDSIKKTINDNKSINMSDIDGIVLKKDGSYVVTVGGIELLMTVFSSSVGAILAKIAIALAVITWIAGIITSIIVQKARKALGIQGGAANIVFAVFKLTGIPFLITAIISHVAISKAAK